MSSLADALDQGAAAFDQFQRLRAKIAQLGAGFFTAHGGQTQHFHVKLGDAAFGLVPGCLKLTSLTHQLRLGALKGKHPVGPGQTLVKQALLIGEFFLDQGQLPGHGIGLGDDAFDLRRDLAATFLQLFSLARGGFAAGEEQLALAFDLFGHIGPGLGQFGQFAGKDRFGLVVALGFQPGAAGDQFEKLTFDDGQFRLQKRAVQPDQQIAGEDRLVFVHGDLGNDAAVQMLHDPAVLVHSLTPPGATMAPSMVVSSAQPPRPNTVAATVTSPIATGRRADHSCDWLMTCLPGWSHW